MIKPYYKKQGIPVRAVDEHSKELEQQRIRYMVQDRVWSRFVDRYEIIAVLRTPF